MRKTERKSLGHTTRPRTLRHATKSTVCKRKKKINWTSVKDPTKRIKTQSNDWEIIFASHSSDKGLVFRLYTEL